MIGNGNKFSIASPASTYVPSGSWIPRNPPDPDPRESVLYRRWLQNERYGPAPGLIEGALSPLDLVLLGTPGGVKVIEKALRSTGQKAALRTISNLALPLGYGQHYTRGMYSSLLKREGKKSVLSRMSRAVLKDKPIWDQDDVSEYTAGMVMGMSRIPKINIDTRRWLLRHALGKREPLPIDTESLSKTTLLKATRVPDTYMYNDSNPTAFNYLEQMREYANDKGFSGTAVDDLLGAYRIGFGRHGMSYSDLWDFKINPGEITDVLRDMRGVAKSIRATDSGVDFNARFLAGWSGRHLLSLTARAAMDKLMTTPVRIAGYIGY